MAYQQTHLDLIHRWIHHLQQRGKSRHTLNAYHRAVSHFILWSQQTYGEAFDLLATMPRDVRDWKAVSTYG